MTVILFLLGLTRLTNLYEIFLHTTDPCVNNGTNPCKHHGECIASPSNFFDFECHCSLGWTGETCNKGIKIWEYEIYQYINHIKAMLLVNYIFIFLYSYISTNILFSNATTSTSAMPSILVKVYLVSNSLST